MERLFGTSTPSVLKVVTDYGEVGKGASNAHFVLAENGTEYLIKGPRFVPSHPTVGGNEWVAAKLADELGLPILDFRLVTMAGEYFFASQWMPSGTFSPGIDSDLLKRCTNRNRTHDVVVFDTWLYNQDRNNENLVVRLPRKSGDPHQLILNDHSHLLICPGGPQSHKDLQSRLDAGPCVSLPFVRESIDNWGDLDRALQGVEALSEARIREVVGTTPVGLLSETYRDAYQQFLVARRSRLRAVFEGHRTAFPNLST